MTKPLTTLAIFFTAKEWITSSISAIIVEFLFVISLFCYGVFFSFKLFFTLLP